MQVFYADHFSLPLPAGHRFPIAKYALLRRRLVDDGMVHDRQLHPAVPVSPALLSVAHDAGYVAAFAAGDLAPAAERELGLPWSAELYRRAAASVGGTLAAARAALRDGVAGSLSGGTHHAHHAHGAGFCSFNDAAVALHVLRAEGAIRTAAVIDLDVHQGDGNASLLRDLPWVHLFDLFGERNYPFRKVLPEHHVALAADTGDDEYCEVLARHLPAAIGNGDLVLYNAGVDALVSDRLGTLSLTHAGLARRDAMVLAACRAAGVPVTITLGGGYAEPIEDSVRAYAGTYREANRVFGGAAD